MRLNKKSMKINIFLKRLEQKSDLDPIKLCSFENEEELSVAQKEVLAFDKKGFPDEFKEKEELINYYTERIELTKNKYLLSRYYHQLYLLTNDPKYCTEALKQYESIVLDLYKIESKYIVCRDTLKLALSLYVRQQKIVTEITKPLMLKVINTGDEDIKIWTLDLVKNYLKMFDMAEKEMFAKICIDLALRSKDYYTCEHAAEMGISFTNKMQDSNTKKILLNKLNEILGDNLSVFVNNDNGDTATQQINIKIYLKILIYYELSGCTEKYIKTILLFNNAKQKVVFPENSFKVTLSEETSKNIKDYYSKIIQYKTEDLINYLINGDLFLAMTYIIINSINEWVNNKNDLIFDINMNVEKSVCSPECEALYCLQNNILNIIFQCLINAIKNKTISYNKIKKHLISKTSFGRSIKYKIDNKEYSYTWFDQIDYALRDFFKQTNKYIDGKNADWRCVIDVLPAKFEGLLRDMVKLQGGITTKEKEGKTTEMLLDDLLRQPKLIEIFTQEDLTLFENVFTNKYYNIRNDVAHGFYKKQNYTIDKAFLVVLCVMRLAKNNIMDKI